MSNQPDQPKTVDPPKKKTGFTCKRTKSRIHSWQESHAKKMKPQSFLFCIGTVRHKSPFFCWHNNFFFQAYHSIAKCVAALAMSCPADRQSVVNQFVKDIQVLVMYFANLLFYVFFEVHVMVSQCFSSFLIRLLYILLSEFRQQ